MSCEAKPMDIKSSLLSKTNTILDQKSTKPYTKPLSHQNTGTSREIVQYLIDVLEKQESSSYSNLEELLPSQPRTMTRTKRWDADLLAFTLFGINRNESQSTSTVRRSGGPIAVYDDFGGGVWGRRRRSISKYDFDYVDDSI